MGGLAVREREPLACAMCLRDSAIVAGAGRCLSINVLALFENTPYRAAMPDTSDLRPAQPDEIATTLSFALRYDGRKRVHHADDLMARITAERLVRHLEASGFVVMKAPPAPAPTTTPHMPASRRG